MKKFILIIVCLFGITSLYAQLDDKGFGSIGFTSDAGIEFNIGLGTIPIYFGWNYHQHKNEAYSFLNYSGVINYGEYPEDHRNLIKDQNIQSSCLNFGWYSKIINNNRFVIGSEIGHTEQIDVLDCYDTSHILGDNGHYQLFLDKRRIPCFGVNFKVVHYFLSKTMGLHIPFYFEIGYNNRSNLYFGIGF